MPVILNPRHRRSPKNLTVNDVFPDWSSGLGIFHYLLDDVTAPWEDVSEEGLDIAYHGIRSGDKFCAPVVYNWLSTDGELTATGIEKIVSAMRAMYFTKWTHLWSLYSSDYSPLDTYNITETRSDSGSNTNSKFATRTPDITETHTGTDNLTTTNDDTTTTTHGHVVTDSGTDTTTDTFGHVVTESGSPTETTTNQIQGYNSSTFEDKSKSSVVSSIDKVTTNSGSDTSTLLHGKVETNSGQDTIVVDQDGTANRTLNLTNKETGTETNAESGSDTFSESHSLTRRGNMYRSPAELMEQDREFWREAYFETVFEDIDQFLTLAIYSEAPINTTIF